MRTLHNYLILYDAECPMCQLYTHAFTKTGMLDPAGRAPYQNIPPSCPLVDLQRAVNEIALVNTQTGEVDYGIESLFKVIGHSLPILRPLFSWRPFLLIMRKVYAFISYNRKVIIPPPAAATATAAPLHAPQPAFHLKYRLAYLAFTILIAAGILTRYTHLLAAILPIGAHWREYLICTGQIFYQGMVVSIIAPAKRWDYLGNMMTISLAGALALLPPIALAAFTPVPAIAATTWFLIVVTLMLIEHIRRCHLLSLDWTLTISWAAYRLVILYLIIH